MSYDEAIKRLEELVQSMEDGEALTIEEYKQKAKEAKELIQFCQQQLTGLEDEMKEALQ
ncbi:MAG: exodeoxyribonuclease VII small subunit [Paludibacteraceae bacterium]|nr:exodeoxyribonuclease VII small subunit [Paludibacteraceae bacterium]